MTPNIMMSGFAPSQKPSMSVTSNWILFAARYVPSFKTRGVPSLFHKFGEAVALYFAFLSSYTHSLIFISILGLVTHYFGNAYSIIYSSLLFLWSVVFVEYWRIRERLHSVAWGCLGSFRAENHRPNYIDGHLWWKRELKIIFSVPVIALFAGLLTVLLTVIFIFEAFVTTLYTGPGHEYVVRRTVLQTFSLNLTYLSSVFCPDRHFHPCRPSLPRNLSETRTKTDSMGEPQASILFRCLPHHQNVCPHFCRSLPRPSSFRLYLRPLWRDCHAHCTTFHHL